MQPCNNVVLLHNEVKADGLRREGDAYVNDAYGDSTITREVDVEGGIGHIIFKAV